jgi:hypothetical protein
MVSCGLRTLQSDVKWKGIDILKNELEKTADKLKHMNLNVNAVKTMNKILYLWHLVVLIRGGGAKKRKGAYFFCIQKGGLLERGWGLKEKGGGGLNTEITVSHVSSLICILWECLEMRLFTICVFIYSLQWSNNARAKSQFTRVSHWFLIRVSALLIIYSDYFCGFVCRSLYQTFGSPFSDSPCRPHEIGNTLFCKLLWFVSELDKDIPNVVVQCG